MASVSALSSQVRVAASPSSNGKQVFYLFYSVMAFVIHVIDVAGGIIMLNMCLVSSFLFF